MGAGALIASFVPILVAVSMRRAEERIHRQLVDAKALTPESAVPLSLERSFDHRRLEALLRSGAVRATENGRHYFDPDGWERHREARRRRVLVVLPIVLAVVGVLITVLLILK